MEKYYLLADSKLRVRDSQRINSDCDFFSEHLPLSQLLLSLESVVLWDQEKRKTLIEAIRTSKKTLKNDLAFMVSLFLLLDEGSH